MRFGMVARPFALFDDPLDGAVRRGGIVNADQLLGQVKIGWAGLILRLADEEPVGADGVECGFDLFIELADRAEVDIERFDRILLANDVVVVDLGGRAAANVVAEGPNIRWNRVVGRHLITHEALDQRV